MQDVVRNVFVAGSILGAWYAIVTIGLLAVGVQWRASAGVSMRCVILELCLLLLINAIVLYWITALGDLASSLSPKVDFRTGAEIHSGSLTYYWYRLLTDPQPKLDLHLLECE